jgi:hypothetical protein
MITLKTSTNKITRETTVCAYDAKGQYLCSETWSGTGGRLAVALAGHVRASAEQQQRRLNLAAASTTLRDAPASPNETRLLAERL